MPNCNNSYFGTEETKKDETKKTKYQLNSIAYYFIVIAAALSLFLNFVLMVLFVTGNLSAVRYFFSQISNRITDKDMPSIKVGVVVGLIVSLIVFLVFLFKIEPKKSDDSSKDESKTTTA